MDSVGEEIKLVHKQWKIDFDEIGSIWYRRPKFPDLAGIEMDEVDREFARREISEFYFDLWFMLREKQWIDHPHDLSIAERKPLQLRLAKRVGLSTPQTLISNSHSEVIDFCNLHKNMVIAKPLSHGAYGEHDSHAIFTEPVSISNLTNFQRDVEISPFILQRRIQINSEVRLVYIGGNIFAYNIISKKSHETVDWRRLPPAELTYQRTEVPPDVVRKIHEYMARFNLKFGAFDFIVDQDNQWVFIEINPSGQFAWLELATGDPLIDSLLNCLSSS